LRYNIQSNIFKINIDYLVVESYNDGD